MKLKKNLHFKILLKIMLTISVLWCAPLFAVNTLADSSDTLYGITDIIAKFMWAACIIVGLILLIVGFSHFQSHRENPKLTPMTTPILYLILGIVAICIPFAERIMGVVDAYEKENQIISTPKSKRNEPSGYIDIDKPLR